jgi:hypothetical protein
MKRGHYLLLFGLLLGPSILSIGGEDKKERKQLLPAGLGQKPFDVTRHSIPLGDIEPGGPPRDGIPALTQPKFVTANEADKFLAKNDRVIGVMYNGEARAYPIKILNWHEAVNDRIGPIPFLVTW